MTTGNQPAAAAPTPEKFAKGKTYYLRYVGKRKYMGEDAGDKSIGYDARFLSVPAGEVVEVSSNKAKQLMRDFRNEWQPSTEADFERSERDRAKREEQEAARAAKEMAASVERARKERLRTARSSQSATDEDDDE